MSNNVNPRHIVIADGTYGEASRQVSMLVEMAESLEWFVRPQARPKAEVEELVQEHLRLVLPQLQVRHADNIRVEFIEGTLHDAAVLYRQLNLSAKHDDSRGPWRKTLGQIAGAVHRDLDKPQFRELIEPPLFPFPGKPGILAGTLAADRSKLGSMTASLTDSDRATIWSLMCDVDQDHWEAIQWQLVHPSSLAENPFVPLVQSYRRGYYPIGLSDGRLIVFSRDR